MRLLFRSLSVTRFCCKYRHRNLSISKKLMEKEPKFYFAASIRGGLGDVKFYHDLIKYLQTFGHVFTEHIGSSSGDVELSDKFIHDRDLSWLDHSNALIAEVTQPSLGVGYEIGRAIDKGKKILCLFRPECGRVLSAMIRGAEDGRQVIVRDYKGDEAKKILKDFLVVNNLI